jgi:hypothetical protein
VPLLAGSVDLESLYCISIAFHGQEGLRASILCGCIACNVKKMLVSPLEKRHQMWLGASYAMAKKRAMWLWRCARCRICPRAFWGIVAMSALWRKHEDGHAWARVHMERMQRLSPHAWPARHH